MEQYIRSYQLTIGQPNSIGFVLDDHDIDFSVKKGQDNDKSINKLTLKIIGLDKEYRDALTAKNNMAIILSAGYQNKTVIFQGKITKASSKKMEQITKQILKQVRVILRYEKQKHQNHFQQELTH